MRIATPDAINLAAHIIEGGGLVVVPTARWYMLCCDATNADACARIFAAKRRPPDKSLLLIAPSAAASRKRFHMTAEAELLAEAFWPGDLALLLPWRDAAEGERCTAVGTPDALVTCDAGVLGKLANRTATPIAATSANISGPDGPGPSISMDEVRDFVASAAADVTVAIDGGVCPTAHHLTIVRCATDQAELVREGVVHKRAVAAVLRRGLTA